MTVLINTDDLAHLTSALMKMDEILKVVHRANLMNKSYPQEVREDIEEHSCREATGNAMSSLLSMAGNEVRVELIRSLNEIRNFILRVEGCDEVLPVDEDELKIIGEMFMFIQTMGKKSSRQLLSFLQASNDNEWGALLLVKGKESTEARHRMRLSDSIKDHFDL